MAIEKIRAKQLGDDLLAQAKELKEEISHEMLAAIETAIAQGYAIGQEDLKIQAIPGLKQAAGISGNTGTFSLKKRLELGKVLEIFDIRVTKIDDLITKTEQQ